jgi:deoxyadenosine/deoxycytidine kinase
MNKLITIVGPSGAGKTTLANALARQAGFHLALEEHVERPFQKLFKQNPKYALANQLDYLIFRAEQEKELRKLPTPAIMDGGLDMDFHGFTRLFHHHGWLEDNEYELCARFYSLTRSLLPLPYLIVAVSASNQTISERLASRNRINIASEKDADLLSRFVNEWLTTLPAEKILQLDISNETIEYQQSIERIIERINLNTF